MPMGYGHEWFLRIRTQQPRSEARTRRLAMRLSFEPRARSKAGPNGGGHARASDGSSQPPPLNPIDATCQSDRILETDRSSEKESDLV